MRKFLTAVLLLAISTVNAQVGIGTTTPNTSAALDVTSTSQGFLPPRMTQLQRNTISSPVAGLIVWCTDSGSSGELQVFNGTNWTSLTGTFVCGTTVTFTYNGSSVTYGTVLSTGGKCWLDRNLGATNVATSSTDAASYGDLFQWGRGADGHQIRISNTSTELSSSDASGNADFILSPNLPYDWLSQQNDNLWQGVNGTNNPCPNGFRLPTITELEEEFASWSSPNSAGALASPLKLPIAGVRLHDTGSFGNVGIYGRYWSSTVNNTGAYSLSFRSSQVFTSGEYRATGRSVRCIKD